MLYKFTRDHSTNEKIKPLIFPNPPPTHNLGPTKEDFDYIQLPSKPQKPSN